MSEFASEVMTPNDIRKAKKAARRDHRLQLRNAVAQALGEMQLDTNTLLQETREVITDNVVRKLENKFFTAKMVDDLVNAAVDRLVRKHMEGFDLKKVITQAAAERAREVIEKNFIVNLKEDTM